MGAEARGHCETRFAAVADAFVANLAHRGELGAAVAVFEDGRPVVDLWGGATVRAQRPAGAWQRDTLVRMMSVNKGMTALCAHHLIDRGLLDPAAPVAALWPEFAQAGKGAITVAQLLGGLAALVFPDEVPDGAAFDWQAMTEGLARQAPAWEPGTRGAYHSSTYGHLVGEVVRRASGLRPGAYFARAFAEPLGLDYHFAVPEAARQRVSEVLPDPGNDTYAAVAAGAGPLGRAWRILPDTSPAGRENPAYWGQEMPSTNGRGNARAVARLYAALACGGSHDGVQVLGPSTIQAMTRAVWEGPCGLTGRQYRYGMGLFLNTPGLVGMGPNPEAFGHPGAGGALGFADPARRLSFAYCTSRMCAGAGLGDRCEALIGALFAATG